MPLFAAFFGSLFSALSVFLAKMFAARLAIRVVGIFAMISIMGVLFKAFNDFIAPLVQQLFATEYGQFLGLAFPPVSGTIVTGLTALWMACATYSMQARAIKLTASL